jgi:transcriptional regulator with XRE-family HTH domain
MTTTARLGEALRTIRQRNGWTLEQVAERSGISRSTLSKVERSKLQLTYDKLARLSKGLGVEINELFGEASTPRLHATRRSITRADDGIAIETGAYSHRYLNTDIMSKRFVPIVVDVKARTLEEFGDMIRHPGEEFIFVITGVVELHTELYAPVRLNPGDSVFFDSMMLHAYLTVGDEPARCVGVCTDLAEGNLV